MSDANLEKTRPVEVQTGAEAGEGRRRGWWLALLGLVILLGVVALGAFGGYRSGLQDRRMLEFTEVARQVEEQFALGVRDLEAGLYDMARQRFEYVIDLDPSYPGATERLAEVLLALNTTATATPEPTPTLTPTPDLRGAEDLFFQAERLLAEGEWSTALETLDTLRKKQPDFRTVHVDGMYYVALRSRGVDKISLEGILEGGMYDLARAERFGPLDVDAEAWRSWARLYVLGASFWDVNWGQAVQVFSELALVAPNLRDTNNWTATERLRQALIKYGNQFALLEDWCSAQAQYEAALQIGPDPNLEPTATQTAQECWTPTPRPRDRDEPTNTPEVTPGPPPEATPTPTQAGS